MWRQTYICDLPHMHSFYALCKSVSQHNFTQLLFHNSERSIEELTCFVLSTEKGWFSKPSNCIGRNYINIWWSWDALWKRCIWYIVWSCTRQITGRQEGMSCFQMDSVTQLVFHLLSQSLSLLMMAAILKNLKLNEMFNFFFLSI